VTYSAISPLAVGTFHAAPRPKGGGGAPNCQSRRRRDHFVGGGGAARPA